MPEVAGNIKGTRRLKSSGYALGRAFEYRVRDDLRRKGYYAQRSPASKTKVDVIGVSKTNVLFIQCKRGGSCGPADWNGIYDLADAHGAKPILAETPGRGIVYHLMTDRKDGTRRPQPMVPFDPKLPKAA